jgi:hypothetical protein
MQGHLKVDGNAASLKKSQNGAKKYLKVVVCPS